jgi:hypothetical protein
MPGTLMSSGIKWSWSRFITILVGLAAGIAGGYFGQPLIHGNDLAINVIVTTFSILAGFLIAIMTIMGDPSAFGRHTWRVSELARSTIKNGLLRQQWLFMLYLATVCAIFTGSLLSHSTNGVSGHIIVWLERVYLFMAILAFVISFRLPGTLLRIQMARHDQVIESRRKNPSGGRSTLAGDECSVPGTEGTK